MILTPKNWSTFQHYKDRAPAWIKLHRCLLDDYAFSCLPVASRALAPCIWLLASEYDQGNITASVEEIAYRLRMTVSDLSFALKPLIDSGFILASEPLADCYQTACLEREKEREKDKDAPSALLDPEKRLYDRGKEVLGKGSGGLIKNLLKAKNGQPALALAAIETASTKSDPREYIGAVIRAQSAQSDFVWKSGIPGVL